jgi:hypothetical protein
MCEVRVSLFICGDVLELTGEQIMKTSHSEVFDREHNLLFKDLDYKITDSPRKKIYFRTFLNANTHF